MAETHKIMGGKVNVYRRANSSNWQCSTFLEGRSYRTTTRRDSLSQATDFAEDWYLGLRGKRNAGLLKTGRPFKHAAEAFVKEYEAITDGERSPKYVDTMFWRLRIHLMPFFGGKSLDEITTGLVHEYRIHRLTSRKDPRSGEPVRPSRSTMKQEIVILRHVLKTAQRRGWIQTLPDLSVPYKASGKVGHRAWFSPEEYRQLYEASRARAKNPRAERWRKASEQMHDYILFMANTGLRPDEASRLEFRDVAIVTDQATRERILEIEVRGKRGVGFCKSTKGAVLPFQRVKARSNGKPTDLVFGKIQRELFNTILNELGMRKDRDGNRRTAYSLRHTYICLRLMEGADIYQIAKNCRTSVEMIEKHYAVHLKHTLDAAAINVRRSQAANMNLRKPKKAAMGECQTPSPSCGDSSGESPQVLRR